MEENKNKKTEGEQEIDDLLDSLNDQFINEDDEKELSEFDEDNDCPMSEFLGVLQDMLYVQRPFGFLLNIDDKLEVLKELGYKDKSDYMVQLGDEEEIGVESAFENESRKIAKAEFLKKYHEYFG